MSTYHICTIFLCYFLQFSGTFAKSSTISPRSCECVYFNLHLSLMQQNISQMLSYFLVPLHYYIQYIHYVGTFFFQNRNMRRQNYPNLVLVRARLLSVAMMDPHAKHVRISAHATWKIRDQRSFFDWRNTLS